MGFLLTTNQIWGTGESPFALTSNIHTPMGSNRPSRAPSPVPSIYGFPVDLPSKETPAEVTEINNSEVDEEKGGPMPNESLGRPLVLTSTVFVGLAMFLILTMLLGFGVSNVVFEVMTDKFWPRLALIATEPFFLVLSIFFAVVIFTDIFQAIGPITSLKTNSRFYSAVKPNLSQAYSMGFQPPHITIQMPVYKESLVGVIMPTVASLKQAISHYESHGGTASIFINDDGMSYLSEQEIADRLDFYHDNNIGWVARPQNNQNGYVRKGKFKKASNMNFGLNLSNKVEGLLCQEVSRRLCSGRAEMNSYEEDLIYKLCLEQALKEDDRARAGGNIRLGEHILIVDCDTRVVCFHS
jgi:hypothetical protein